MEPSSNEQSWGKPRSSEECLLSDNREHSVNGSCRIWTLALVCIIAVLLSALPGAGYTQSTRDVVISEIAWMGTTASSNDEWIELYNNTSSAIDFAGWTPSDHASSACFSGA